MPETLNSVTSVNYMERTRLFYRAQGYERDYVWAHFDAVPFTPLSKPLDKANIALVTTASPEGWQRGQPKAVWSGDTAKPPAALFTDDLAWDKDSTHTNDLETFLPIRATQRLVERGVVQSIARRFHGVPSEYSQSRTIEYDGPEILQRCRQDGVDAVLLVPL